MKYRENPNGLQLTFLPSLGLSVYHYLLLWKGTNILEDYTLKMYATRSSETLVS